MLETSRCWNAVCTLQEAYLPFCPPCQFGFTPRVLSWSKFAQGEIPVAFSLVCPVGHGEAATCCHRDLCQSVSPLRGAGQALAAAGYMGWWPSVWVMPPEVPSPQSLSKALPMQCCLRPGGPSCCWGHGGAPLLSGMLAWGRARSYSTALKAEEVSWGKTCNRQWLLPWLSHCGASSQRKIHRGGSRKTWGYGRIFVIY